MFLRRDGTSSFGYFGVVKDAIVYAVFHRVDDVAIDRH